MKKKAMLSQPMAGRTEQEIIATRDRAIAELERRGYEVVNTLFTDEWYSPENDTVRIVRSKGGYLVQPELPETVGRLCRGNAHRGDTPDRAADGAELPDAEEKRRDRGRAAAGTGARRALVLNYAGRDRPAGGRRHRRAAVPPRLSTARGHGQRGDAPKVAASGGDELVRLGRAGGIKTRRIKTWISKVHSRQ